MDKPNFPSKKENDKDKTETLAEEAAVPIDSNCAKTETDEVRAVCVSTQTLLHINYIRVGLLTAMPRAWRSKMTEETFIQLLLATIADEYATGSGNSPIVNKLRKQFRELPESLYK